VYVSGSELANVLLCDGSDVDWLSGILHVQRSIVSQIVGDVKTPESDRALHISNEILAVFKVWKQTTGFSGPDDWMFASPAQLGTLPWSYDQVWRMYQKAAGKVGIGALANHSLRHAYPPWLDAVGTPVGIQQKLMRHADIRTPMNIDGDAGTEEMRSARKGGQIANAEELELISGDFGHWPSD
jgi:integrase